MPRWATVTAVSVIKQTKINQPGVKRSLLCLENWLLPLIFWTWSFFNPERLWMKIPTDAKEIPLAKIANVMSGMLKNIVNILRVLFKQVCIKVFPYSNWNGEYLTMSSDRPANCTSSSSSDWVFIARKESTKETKMLARLRNKLMKSSSIEMILLKTTMHKNF